MSPRHSALALLALGLALLLAAGIAPAPIVRAAPPEPATAPLAGGMSVDGYVSSFTPAGDRIYVAGDFSYLGERVRGLTVLDQAGRIAPGARPGNTPHALGYAIHLAPDGAGGWFAVFIGQGSPSVYTVARLGPDMQPLAGWPASANGAINDVALQGDTLYVAGSFSSIGGQPRGGLAALDAASGAVRPWVAPFQSSFARIAASASTLYAAADVNGQLIVNAIPLDGGPGGWSVPGGSSSYPGPQRLLLAGGRLYLAGPLYGKGPDGAAYTADDTSGLVILDAQTGAAVGPTVQVDKNSLTSLSVFDVAVSADTIYLAGEFRTVNGQPRAGLAAVSATTGALRPWSLDLRVRDPNTYAEAPGVARSLSLSSDRLYVAGFFELIGGQPRRNLAALSADTGELLAWRGSANQIVDSMAAAGQQVAISGDFTLAGGSPGADVAAIDSASGQARFWEARQTGTRLKTKPAAFGNNNAFVFPAAALGDDVYINMYDGGSRGSPPVRALDRDSAALRPWSGPADAESALAAGGGMLFISRAGSATTAVVAAYDPLGTTPRWERTVGVDRVNELLVSGDTLYGVGSTLSGGAYTGRVFALGLADGAVRWDHPVAGQPAALALDAGALYVGGKFQSIAGEPRVNLAPLDAASGEPLPWPAALAPNNMLNDLVIGQGRLYLGGEFLAVGAAPRAGLAAIDLGASPALSAWDPQPLTNSNLISYIYALALTDSALYVGASFPDGTSSSSYSSGVYGMLVYPLSAPDPTATPSGSPTAGTPASTTTTPTDATATSETPTASLTTPTGTTTTPTGTTATSETPSSSPTTPTGTTATSETPGGTATGSPTEATTTGTSAPTTSTTPATTGTPAPTGTPRPDDHRVYLPQLQQ